MGDVSGKTDGDGEGSGLAVGSTEGEGSRVVGVLSGEGLTWGSLVGEGVDSTDGPGVASTVAG